MSIGAVISEPLAKPAAARLKGAVAGSVVVVTEPPAPAIPRIALWQLAALIALLAWAFLPMLRVFFDKWVNDPQYSHGFLVPLFSAYLLWKSEPQRAFSPRPWLGGCLLILCVAMRGAAGSLLFHQLDAAAFLLGLAAIALAAGGMPLVRRTAPAIAFLIFMVPLPYELERNVGQPLKDAATASSTYLLQTLGQPAIRDGNLILIDEVKLGVVDACSGLKMMMTFAAFSMGAVLLMRRSRFEKIMVLLGIIPIAIAANVLRITATGLVSVATANQETLHFCHDLFGWLMMPVGLALLGLEVWILKRLVVEPA
ncbi:MAG TPA: exosortase/archaeosortase family protein [Urbifossiella sp.]|nr:exosortase/archaeosortase family protein [Urbifossiella sp.]